MRFSTRNLLLISSLASSALAKPIPDDDADLDNQLASLDNMDLSSFSNVAPAFFDPGPDKRDVPCETSSGSPLLSSLSLTLRDAVDDLVVRTTSKWSDDQKLGLKLHNQARKAKSISKVKWDAKLAADALAYAKQLAGTGRFQHSNSSSRPGQGENLAFSSSTGAAITNPIAGGVKMWLAEASNYNGEIIPQGNFASYGHYTQCMWNTTTKIGLAAASDNKGGWYVVGRYSPPGNIQGLKPY